MLRGDSQAASAVSTVVIGHRKTVPWHGRDSFREGKKTTIVLEAIADADLWIRHVCSEAPGSLKDINLMASSLAIGSILVGTFPPRFSYVIHSIPRSLPYYLADRMYPNWSIFVKTIKTPANSKEIIFSNAQKAIWKYIERAFGVLMARWQVLDRPSRLWYRKDMTNIVMTCIIIHNMIVESRRGFYESGIARLSDSSEGRELVNGGVFQ